MSWTQEEAIELCCKIEAFAPLYGCHVALTGGTLYKPGVRKDVDIVFYRIRQTPAIDVDGLMAAMTGLGIETTRDFGWVCKAAWRGRVIDFLFPERADSAAIREQEYA